MKTREISWHTWSVSEQLPKTQTEDEVLEVMMGVMVNLGDPQREIELFTQEGVSKKDYVEISFSNLQK